MLVSDIDAANKAISALTVDSRGIAAQVSSLQTSTEDAIDGLSDNLTTLSQSVEAKMTDEEVSIKISEALSNGVDKVETSTGFTFNDIGLSISKSDSEMSTTITEDGMTVYRNGSAVLTANNAGVDAVNLHATTYLIIGNNSRLEDYGSDRTGCFWIGG
jgi:methylthioribose-1-phosphate isomerase